MVVVELDLKTMHLEQPLELLEQLTLEVVGVVELLVIVHAHLHKQRLVDQVLYI
jgi:hypothetical protein|tara:strand:+ start:815 stop:976 length:162 start_codon:yes stop_codon:yes gene_type:complete